MFGKTLVFYVWGNPRICTEYCPTAKVVETPPPFDFAELHGLKETATDIVVPRQQIVSLPMESCLLFFTAREPLISTLNV